MSPASIACPACDAGPLQPCTEDGCILTVFHADRHVAARTEEDNVVLSMWRLLSGAALDAERARREAERRTEAIDPGVVLPPVVREDEPC